MSKARAGFERLGAVALLAVAPVFASDVSAQNYPSRAGRIVVPFQPGGGADIQARILGKKFYESLGQTFVVDNRSGAGGSIGAEIVAKAPPDGYTLLFSTASLAVNTTLQKKPGFDPVKDLAPVSWFSSAPLVLVVHPSVPARSVKELVAIARQNRGKLNAGSNGSGTTSHLAIEMFKQYAGISVTHIPYKGGGPAAQAIVAGEIDMRFTGQLAVLPHLKAGRVRPLAIASTRKSSIMPELPTLDSMYPGFDADNWYAMFITAGTPRDIIAKLSKEIVKVLQAPEMRDAIIKDGAEPVGSTPEELGAYFRREVEKYAKVIRAANVQVE
ncbi:MAG TPA: tripartite tricarboxylate transporter substrate binding protein [Burkholderiales bacterium]|nr:tripartite tricarboxylate transporter substrate binding protein [Burkholderiales bacterium]